MWFRRHPSPVVPPASPQGIVVRVIGLLSPGYARVIVGLGCGMLDCGSEQDWPVEWVPAASRRPNGEFRIAGFSDRIPQVIGD